MHPKHKFDETERIDITWGNSNESLWRCSSSDQVAIATSTLKANLWVVR